MYRVRDMDEQNYDKFIAMTYASFLKTYCGSSYRNSEGCKLLVKNHEQTQNHTLTSHN